MYTEGSKFGKFEGCESRLIGELLYSMDSSWHADSCGDVSENGRWYALVHGKRYHFIVTECDQGFVDYDVYSDRDQALADWALIESTVDAWYDMLGEYEKTVDAPVCKMCHGVVRQMGVLGRLVWYRCIDCGMEQSIIQ